MNVMYCAEQINIPVELGPILKQYTKAIVRDNPESVAKWSANYFAKLAGMPPMFDTTGRLVTAQGSANTRTTASSRDGVAGGINDVIVNPDAFESLPTGGAVATSMDSVVENVFRRYDKDGNGKIDAEEVHTLISDLIAATGMTMTDEDLKEFLSLIDADEDGRINLEEFKHLFFQE
eukprot:PhF_6_TR6326/c0_g1_i1/m.9585